MSGKAASSIALAAALAACGSEDAPSPGAAVAAGLKSRIDALRPAARDALFLRAVRDAGHDCQRVVGSAYNGVHFGMPGWAARCSDGVDWLVMLRADGTALVARREEKLDGA